MNELTAEQDLPEVCDICGAAPIHDDDGLHCPAEGNDLHNLVYWLGRLPANDADACAMRLAGRVVIKTLADQRAEIARLTSALENQYGVVNRLMAAVAAQEAELFRLKTAHQSQWIPIGERLPEVGEDIIATFITGDVYPVVVDRDSDGDLFFNGSGRDSRDFSRGRDSPAVRRTGC